MQLKTKILKFITRTYLLVGLISAPVMAQDLTADATIMPEQTVQVKDTVKPFTPFKLDGVAGVVGDYVVLEFDIDKTLFDLKQQGQNVSQTLVTPQINFTSEGTIKDNTITFSQSNLDVSVLLLPDGASSTTPLSLKTREPFLLEFGWLVETNKRLRLIRQYDEQGKWVNVTLVNEYRKY